MLGPFNSPLAKHLHAAALASQRDGHRLSLGSRDRAGRTPPASISSIEVGAGARSPGEQLGVSSPTSPAAQRSRLAASSSAAARSPGPPADTAQSAAAQPPPPPPGPADALQQLAVSKRPSRTSGAGSAQRPAAQRPRPLLYQQQVAAPPTASLEEAMGQLQLQGGSLAAAVGPSGTPSLAIRSRGLLTPLTTPRGRPESAAAALPPAAAATPVPLSAATPQQRAQQTQQTQAAQQAGAAAEPLLGQPLWSPMLPAGAAQAAPLGAGLLSTTRKAPRDGGSAAGPSSATGAGSGPAAEVESASAGAAQQGAGLQQEASFGEPTDNPAQLRRQLQAIVPELTLTQLPAAAPAAAAGTGAQAGAGGRPECSSSSQAG
ncbi:hypothetical protein C2E21_7799 [Chlorella sorokiniana]|uniref:Uncharacterized protein n=1 Tax=Chlorella sorokiniana TaxID=3076 RepID=A0A2P6TGN6_CHLSO|nr:hypothetical protein C2E21_7799 [Chlorella sorokiniana]|eukprot:PRW33284.1 hypothetical protein C2E21_7799 [Chlorella sorokiniana]